MIGKKKKICLPGQPTISQLCTKIFHSPESVHLLKSTCMVTLLARYLCKLKYRHNDIGLGRVWLKSVQRLKSYELKTKSLILYSGGVLAVRCSTAAAAALLLNFKGFLESSGIGKSSLFSLSTPF